MIAPRHLVGTVAVAGIVLLGAPAEAAAPGSQLTWLVDPPSGVVTAVGLRGCGEGEVSLTVAVDARQVDRHGTVATAHGERTLPCSGEAPDDVRVVLDTVSGRFRPGPAELTVGAVVCAWDDDAHTSTSCRGGSDTVEGRLRSARSS